MARSFKAGNYIKFAIYLVVVILINVAGTTLFFRADLTREGVFSLSDASKRVVSTLSEPLTINVFFTQNLPAPHNNTEQYLRDLLEEYGIYANQYFNYRFYDVSPDEGDIGSEARANQDLASSYGINPIQIQIIEEDEVKFQKAYMGVVLIHGDLIERIPTITSTSGLEYRLTSAIMKLNNKISALLSLSDPIQIKLFLSSSLKQVAPLMGLNPLLDLPEQTKSLVDKLNPRHFGKLAFQYFDPTTDAQAAETVRQENYNLLNLNWPDFQSENVQAGDGMIGLVLRYGKKHTVLPLLTVIRIPIIGTQYELMSADQMETAVSDSIESLIDINEDLGYLTGHGTPPLSAGPPMGQPNRQPPDALNSFRALASMNYSIKSVDLAEDGIPSGLNTLVIVRPTEAFSEHDLFQIDQFLMRGKSLALFLDRFNEVFLGGQNAMRMGQGPQYIPLDTGLEKLLEHYGVRIKKSLVMDENCFKQDLDPRQGGGQRPIYFAPLIESRFINNELDFMRTIKRMITVKISPLELDKERITQNKLVAHRLFASSEKSWEMRDRINLNPMFITPPQSPEEQFSMPLAYLIEGEFPSYFADKPVPEKQTADDPQPDKEQDNAQQSAPTEKPTGDPQQPQIQTEGDVIKKGRPGKIVLIASSEMFRDNVLDAQGETINSLFTMNLLDALNDREDMALLRGKRQQLVPLDPTSGATKTAVKTMNIIGLPMLVVLFGIVVWSRRAARKKRIQEMFTS